MRPPFTNESYYHIYNRGVIKHPIFFDLDDYRRFVRSLIIFNDACSTPIQTTPQTKVRNQIISILSWCLMPNHYHLFVKQKIDGGISLFQKKLGDGYTKYINTKYRTKGHVFEGKYQVKQITNDSHFIHLSRYIHLNPKELKPKSVSTEKFIEQFRWSSYLDWIGIRNYPDILDMQNMNEVRGMSADEYKKFVIEWIDESTHDSVKSYDQDIECR